MWILRGSLIVQVGQSRSLLVDLLTRLAISSVPRDQNLFRVSHENLDPTYMVDILNSFNLFLSSIAYNFSPSKRAISSLVRQVNLLTILTMWSSLIPVFRISPVPLKTNHAKFIPTRLSELIAALYGNSRQYILTPRSQSMFLLFISFHFVNLSHLELIGTRGPSIVLLTNWLMCLTFLILQVTCRQNLVSLWNVGSGISSWRVNLGTNLRMVSEHSLESSLYYKLTPEQERTVMKVSIANWLKKLGRGLGIVGLAREDFLILQRSTALSYVANFMSLFLLKTSQV